ncbi:UDP-N-acetylglucosamine:LPS N-acetylglucosamine transferase [Treponema sp. JC4]|uniref:UDP-N-acetylglucosamine--N-acetylmuramyl- (pentapeptide) pyrophosphoryl-undecaprenol N-acetylglucosamine transferase n=1 Tax=Treponema sp. JC4 TaxID=1124982 RepID=UPI00025B0536|nr:UDP-N-acetylglucosamine--N-acetylmuramyl-(pentapeptide) pyrophosphoryl-undecaprenol N-acetylglucosamine transferase [Treponema sp. JC4]EID85008.1 UDP-N-acetylglucosamine:LPS N-acetylglucosamine transferase [Treponema sp. JC4]
MKLNKNLVAFTGGGTGGHIYPGLAVADEIKKFAGASGSDQTLKIIWLGCSKGMDKKIVESAVSESGKPSVEKFYGIPSGKLRRYFSLQNFFDLFKIFAGFVSAFFILKKNRPCVLFSKGGFVSVPPCIAARLLHIPVYTHECDFSLGLANRINFKSAKKMFVSFEETKNLLSEADKERVIVSGNPVRPVFYKADGLQGRRFLGIQTSGKPLLLVLGGSSGARQINNLVFDNLDWLCQRFTVVHQTGLLNNDENREGELKEKYGDSYKPYQFIYKEMPDVVAAADVVLSRAGANSIWEAAVLYKPMLLIPLCGSGTRGDQVDNAKFFEENHSALVLIGDAATSENMKTELTKMLEPSVRENFAAELKKLCGEQKPAQKIAEIIYEETK